MNDHLWDRPLHIQAQPRKPVTFRISECPVGLHHEGIRGIVNTYRSSHDNSQRCPYCLLAEARWLLVNWMRDAGRQPSFQMVEDTEKFLNSTHIIP